MALMISKLSPNCFFYLQLNKRAPKKIPSALAALKMGTDKAKSIIEFKIFIAWRKWGKRLETTTKS